MSTSGENNFKGINSQAKAAMSLFLQFLRDPRFLHVKLEGKKLEDFTLFFEDGHKIICESKDRKEKFNYSHLKEVLGNIATKNSAHKNDEILIVCSNINNSLQHNVKYLKYSLDIKKTFQKKRFSESEIALLPKVRFWVVVPKFNSEIIYSLFVELMNFWIPSEEVERLVKSILIDKIYEGSANGGTYSRLETIKQIETLKSEIQDRGEEFNDKVKAREKQFQNLEKIVVNGGRFPTLGTGSLATFSTRWDLTSFAMDRLKTRTNLDLKKWDDLWQMNRVSYFTFGIFDVFKNNLNNKKNREYVIEFIKKHTKKARGFYRSDYFVIDVVKILKEIIQQKEGPKYHDDAFLIIKDLLTFDPEQYLYLKGLNISRDEWERGEISKVLLQIYQATNAKLQQKIVDFIFATFDITEDDGEFDWHAPSEIYTILHSWLSKDFKERFPKIVKTISGQYDASYLKYGKKLTFKGWEHMGGGTSFLNGNYHIGDRHFIASILKPAIEEYYKKDSKEGWKFIKRYCLTKSNKISRSRPDFLNRSIYQIVLDRYGSEEKEVSREAFQILSDFILTKKGIPHKSDLVYQSLVNMKISADKKWRLINLTIKKYDAPVNSFVEKIVRSLVKEGHVEAREALRKWYGNEKYFRGFMSEHESIENIRAMLEDDIDFAIELLLKLLQSDNVQGDKDKHFSSYEIAVLLQKLLNKNYEKGLSVLRWLEARSELSQNQQIIYAFSLFSHQGNDGSDSSELLVRVYDDVIEPLLKRYKNSSSFCHRFSHAHSRDTFVQFAGRIAVQKEIGKALRIVEFFIDDPDPYLPGQDPEDRKDEYNEQTKIEEGKEPNTITSVRGWCGWVLMKCAVLPGRDFMPKIISLTKKLIEDQNYYAVHMGCFALTQIVRNRLTVLPSDRNILFLNDDKVTALEMAKEIEKIAFDLLDRLLAWPAPVQKAMAESVLHVFDPIRTLNEKEALEFVNKLALLPSDSIYDSAAYLIFYAEVRKNAYPDWKLSSKGLYDDLGPDKYDDAKFKKILRDLIKKTQQKDPDHCFKFAAKFEHAMRDAIDKNENVNKYTELALEYFEPLTDIYAHNVFTLIFQILEQRFLKPDDYMERWYALLIKCLKIEKAFYDEQEQRQNLNNVYWYPALYHSHILELLHAKMGEARFMEAAEIFFSFPDRMQLHESDSLVSIINDIAKRDTRAQKIIEKLIKMNPSKYFHLTKKKSK